MWQEDNDRYALWRLEHELAPKKIDRLLDSVTVSDRAERIAVPMAGRAAAIIQRVAKTICAPLPAALRVRRASE